MNDQRQIDDKLVDEQNIARWQLDESANLTVVDI